jgi:hypothetical protein
MAKGDPSAADPQAQFTRGSQALAEAQDWAAFAGAVGLIEQAAAAGHAEATCRVAAFEAIGAGRERSWPRAFDRLQSAAELGSEEAQAQLRLLSGSAGSGWAELRAGIDLRGLLAPPPLTSLSEQPNIATVAGFASPQECAWLIERFRPKLEPAMVWDRDSGGGTVHQVRTNSAVELGVGEMDVVTAIIRTRISVAIGVSEPQFEVPQVMHYTPGQQFQPHFDFLDPNVPGEAADMARRGQRVVTVLIFLNEEYTGGETEFPSIGLRHRGKTGDALLFTNIDAQRRPDRQTLHAGRPPTSGEKWIVSQWIRDRAPGG